MITYILGVHTQQGLCWAANLVFIITAFATFSPCSLSVKILRPCKLLKCTKCLSQPSIPIDLPLSGGSVTLRPLRTSQHHLQREAYPLTTWLTSGSWWPPVKAMQSSPEPPISLPLLMSSTQPALLSLLGSFIYSLSLFSRHFSIPPTFLPISESLLCLVKSA